MELMHSVPDIDLARIHAETDGGGYTEARLLVETEISRRIAAVALLGTVDIAVWDCED